LSFNVAATYQAEPGKEAEVEGYLLAMIGPTRAEPGCESYRILRSRDDNRVFLLIESYQSEDDFEFHKNSPHFDQNIRNGVWTALESRSVIFGEEIGV